MRFLTVIALCLAATPAAAENFFGGSQLLEACDNQSGLTAGYIAGWVAKHDSDKFVMATTMRNNMDDKRLRSAEKKMRANVCMRDSVTITQATEAFCKYLKQDPAARRQSPSDALASALSAAWPCPDAD
jgi:hypothetical protein